MANKKKKVLFEIGEDGREITNNKKTKKKKSQMLFEVGEDGKISTYNQKDESNFAGGFFKKSKYLDDGYQFGDTLKATGSTLGSFAADLGEGFLGTVEGGTDRVQYKLSDALKKMGADNAANSLKENAKVNSTGAFFGKNENDNLFGKGWADRLKEGSTLGDTTSAIIQGIGQIGAMAGTSYLGGAALGGGAKAIGVADTAANANKIRNISSAFTSYTTSYGRARSEAYEKGEDDNTAKKAGVISGLSEAISEQFFDGMPGLKSQGWGGKLTGKVASSLEKTFGTKTGKIFMKLANAGGEGVEEIISNTITSVSNDIVHKIDSNYTYGMENQTGNILEDALNSVTSEESLKSAAIAAMTSAILGGGQAAISTAERNTLLREYARENNITFEEAKKQFETTINDETNAMAENKSFNEKMDIQENIRRQELDNMKKGIFVEKGQRDQAFQYKETDNEQVNNMLRSLSEKGNNTSKNHQTAKIAEKLIRDLGYDIEFTNDEELRAKGLPEADGYKEGNKLVLNLNSRKFTSFVLGHETTHFLENQGELYDAVSKAVFDLATTKGIHEEQVEKTKKLYANIIENKINEEMQNKGRALTEQEINKITDDIVRSELTANYVGDFFNDEEFFRTLGKENPSILQRLAEFFDELLSKITGNTERQQIHEAKRKIKKVYAEYMNGGQINLENSQEAQTRNKVITEQKQQDSINIPTKQETTQKQEINKSSEVNLPTAEKIENKNEENAQKNENTVQKIEKTDNETETTEENIPTKTKIDNEEGIKKIKEKYDTTEKVTGSKKTIVLSNGEKLSGTYKLIEAGNVSASHNAETFEKTEGFPTTENGTTVNDRDYQSDKNAQNLVTQKSDNFDGRAFADNGVIVTKDGIVVSGNDRTMSGDLAAKKGTDTAYIEYLKDNASQFGFTVEQIENMKHPRVVFELNKKLPYDTKTFAMFNKDAKKSKSVSERAKEIGKTIDEDTINSVSEIIDNFDTIDDLYNNEKATRELISLMQTKNIIDSNDLSDVYNGSKFTGSGKDLVESVILGSVINEDNAKYFSNNNDLKFKVMKAAPALIQNKTLNDYSINELFNNAVEVYKKASSSKMTLDEFTSQSNIFGDNDVDLVTKRIAQLLETKGYKNLRNFIEKYNAMAEFPASGQTDIFSGGQVETKEDILRKALNIDDNTEIQYLISDRQYNINDFARRFAKATNYKDEISMDFISKVANAYAYGELKEDYDYTEQDNIEDEKFANDLIEKIKFELDKKGYHLNQLEDRFVKNNRQYMLSDTDNKGRKLTKEQKEYFKNSKVVDEKGNLLTVYRGEPTKGKTEYMAKKGGGNKETNEYGIYFTNSKDFAKDFAFERIQDPNDIFFVKKGKEGELKESYLNITNPLNLGTISREEISNLYDYASDMGKLDGKEIFINNMLNWQRIGNHQLMKLNLDMKEIADNTIYDGLIAKLNVQGDEIEYAVFNSNQIKNVDNTKPTTNADIRYMLSDNQSTDDKINQSMTMDEAKDMVQRIFTLNGIKDWYDDKYKNGDEWLAGEGIDEVEMYAENTELIQNKFINKLINKDNGFYDDYYLSDILNAYQNGTLTGETKQNIGRIDTSKNTNYKDNRFYAPQDIKGGKELYDLANQRVTNNNRSEVYKARADFIINAHNKGYTENLGLTTDEVNKRLKSWANYPKKAMELSQTLNEGVSKQNQWSGMENSSIVNSISISNDEMAKMVKEIKGDSNGWQRSYITGAMLAIDTHIDYSNLTFDFEQGAELMKKHAAGDYDSTTDVIRIGNGGQNTVAHEMGHYIDYLWGKQLFGRKDTLSSLVKSYDKSKFTTEQIQFIEHFNEFQDSIERVGEQGDTLQYGSSRNASYWQKPTETFARFVGKFTEWVKNQATNNRYGYEEKLYKDKFTESQYKEFVKILQEKSALDTTTDNQYMLKGDEMSGIYTPKNQFTNRLSDGLIQENLPTEETTNLPISNTNNEEENIFEKPTRRQVIDRNRQLAREQLGDITQIKDKKKGIMYQLNTMKRNLRDIMSPEQAKSMYETYFRPITENNAKMENDITSYNERIQKYNLNNEESVYTQMLGELRYNPDSELTSKEVNDYYEKNSRKIDAGKVDKAIEEFRSIYDELIGRVNQTLTANGYKEIEYRQGYFPHFIEEKATSPIGKFAEKLGWKVKSGQLPTDIAGITDQFKPGKTWTTFSQHRTGDATDYNALKGLDNYLRGAMDVIHHTNDIQKLRALENEIRYQYSEKGIKEKIDSIYADDTLDMEEKNDAIYTLTNNMRNSGLGNFVTEIRNYTDNLANKKAFGDRSMEQQFGRDTYSIMQNINSRVSANMVGGNISSALTNFIPITQAWSQLSTKNLMKGMYESIKTSIKDDGFANNSVYLTNRTKQADRLYKSGIDKINDKLGIPFEAIDSFASNTIVRAKYHDNIEKGMSEQEAIRNADEFAKDVMAGRSKGDMPTIMNQKNPLVKLMTAFQLEVNNQYGYMFKDIPADLGDEAKRKLVGAFIKLFFGAWLYNQLSEKVTGRKSAFSPIDMAIDDIKTASNENLDLGDKISAIAEDTAQELPFVGGLLGGGRLPIQAAIPYGNPLKLEMVTGTISDVSKVFDEDETKKKNAIKKLKKEWSKPVYYVAMPFGGGQIKKTVEGISMYNENLPVAGSYTDSGKLRFEAPEDTLGKLQAAVFGQYASKNAREYFDNGYQPLTEKQINTALDAGLNINEYREYKSGIKAQENNNDKINYINNLPLENEQKNVLANDVLKRKEKVDISDYGNYGSLEEFDYANKNPGKYNAITQITDFNSYNKYKDEINAIKDQYEDTNERKQAVFSYINSLELNKYQKLMLQKLASGYSIKNYKREMQNYINSLELSAAEKQQIDDALFK